MPVKVKRKERENTQSFIHRFTTAVRGSGTLLAVKGRRFKIRSKSKQAKKVSALRREQLKKQRALDKKLGKPNVHGRS